MHSGRPKEIAKRGFGIESVAGWMRSKNHRPFPFQRACWKSIVSGHSGILHSPTGTGKTLAIWLGGLAHWLQENQHVSRDKGFGSRRIKGKSFVPIQVVWVTPLRALAADTLMALREPVEALGLPWLVELRTSDTSSQLKTKQNERLPSCLITTPESLSVLISYPKTCAQFSTLKLIVLDEWHELMGTKRGVQAELGLSRLRAASPQAMTWAVSATIGNVEEAMHTALGNSPDPSTHSTDSVLEGEKRVLIQAPSKRKTSLRSLIPKPVERFPWAGHMGLGSLDQVVNAIESANSSLVFTNTRSQAERWYAAILHAKKEWAGKIGLHHGSLDRKKRAWVEQELDAGNLRCVVCTASLDLGVDFFPVEQVLQIGSPKGIARLLQRAGRSGHYPGGKSQLVFVPTHALELVELAAAKKALRDRKIESRIPLTGCLDVLAQHVITRTAGEACHPESLLQEIRCTNAFKDLTDTEWKWVLDFVHRGGESLRAYPEFQRLTHTERGLEITDQATAKRHRMTIGTINSDREVTVKFLSGPRLGTIEERFVSKLKPGDKFTFSGRTLQLVQIRDMTAWVRRASGKVAPVPRWMGGHMPLSSELAKAVRQQLGDARNGVFRGIEMRAVKPLLELQARWSEIPDEDTLLIEQVKTRDGFHLFFYPFEGRLVNEGLAAILAWRMSRLQPITFATTVNDYGIELLSPTEPPLQQAIAKGLLSPVGLEKQIEQSMNATELERRQFRDIARIAGLVFGGLPGQGKSTRQLQASSDMFFDVFRDYDPENLLLQQARREVLCLQLEQQRLESAMQRLALAKVSVKETPKPTPLAFPILVDRLKLRLSSEKLTDRIQRMTRQFETFAGKAK